MKIRKILSACLIRSASIKEYKLVSKYGLTPDVPIATEKKNKPRRIDVNGEIAIFVTGPEEITSVNDNIFRVRSWRIVCLYCLASNQKGLVKNA